MYIQEPVIPLVVNTATPIAPLMSGVGPGETQNWSRNAILTINAPASIETSVQAPAQRKVDNDNDALKSSCCLVK